MKTYLNGEFSNCILLGQVIGLDQPQPAPIHSRCHERQEDSTQTIHGPHAEGDNTLIIEAMQDRLDSAQSEARLWFWLAIAQGLLSLYLLATAKG